MPRTQQAVPGRMPLSYPTMADGSLMAQPHRSRRSAMSMWSANAGSGWIAASALGCAARALGRGTLIGRAFLWSWHGGRDGDQGSGNPAWAGPDHGAVVAPRVRVDEHLHGDRSADQKLARGAAGQKLGPFGRHQNILLGNHHARAAVGGGVADRWFQRQHHAGGDVRLVPVGM